LPTIIIVQPPPAIHAEITKSTTSIVVAPACDCRTGGGQGSSYRKHAHHLAAPIFRTPRREIASQYVALLRAARGEPVVLRGQDWNPQHQASPALPNLLASFSLPDRGRDAAPAPTPRGPEICERLEPRSTRGARFG
jgi:hypothetical protein